MSQDYAAVYDPERMSKLMDIVPRFNAYAQPSDIVHMGIVGDKMFPTEYNANRPEARILEVNQVNNGVEIQMQNMQSGEVFTVPANNADPHLLWEYSPESFENVLQRAMNNDDGNGGNGGIGDMAEFDVEEVEDYSGAGDGGMGAVDAVETMPLSSVDGEMFNNVMQELNETRAFANNMVKVIKNMNKEAMRMDNTYRSAFQQLGLDVDTSLKFAPMFHSEYKAMMSDASSDSSVSDNMSESSMSSEGSEFAANLLAAP